MGQENKSVISVMVQVVSMMAEHNEEEFEDVDEEWKDEAIEDEAN